MACYQRSQVLIGVIEGLGEPNPSGTQGEGGERRRIGVEAIVHESPHHVGGWRQSGQP